MTLSRICVAQRGAVSRNTFVDVYRKHVGSDLLAYDLVATQQGGQQAATARALRPVAAAAPVLEAVDKTSMRVNNLFAAPPVRPGAPKNTGVLVHVRAGGNEAADSAAWKVGQAPPPAPRKPAQSEHVHDLNVWTSSEDDSSDEGDAAVLKERNAEPDKPARKRKLDADQPDARADDEHFKQILGTDRLKRLNAAMKTARKRARTAAADAVTATRAGKPDASEEELDAAVNARLAEISVQLFKY